MLRPIFIKTQANNILPICMEQSKLQVISEQFTHRLENSQKEIVIISSIGFTETFLGKLTNKLLPMNESNSLLDNEKAEVNEPIFYNTLSSSQTNKNIQWLYTEILITQLQLDLSIQNTHQALNNIFPKKYIKSMFLLSSILIFEINNQKQLSLLKQLLFIFQLYQDDLGSDFYPKIIIYFNENQLTRQKIENQIKRINIKIHFNIYVQMENDAIINSRIVIKQQKQILNLLSPKRISNRAIDYQIMLFYLELYMSKDEDQILLSWNKALQNYYQERKQQTVRKYSLKLQELKDKQQIIGINQLSTKQFKFRKQLLKQIQNIQQYKIIQKQLLTHKEQFNKSNINNILQWGQQYFTKVYDQQWKNHKQIKNINIYKQEIYLLVQQIKKQAQKYYNSELYNYLLKFIIQKIFQNIILMENNVSKLHQESIKSLQLENKQNSNQLKQSKKKYQRLQNEMQILKLQNSQKQFNYQMQRNNNEKMHRQLKEQIEQHKEIFENKINQSNIQFINQKYQIELQLQSTIQSKNVLIKKVVVLESQLKKQQLLHQQTKTHYQELISNYHYKEEQLHNQILSVSRCSEQEIDILRLSSTRQIQDWQSIAIEARSQIQKNEKQAKMLQKEMISLNQQLNLLKISSKSKIQILKNKISEYELKIKILESFETQSEQLKIKCHKIRQQKQNVSLRLKKKEQDYQLLTSKNQNLYRQLQETIQKKTMQEQRYETMAQIFERQQNKYKRILQNSILIEEELQQAKRQLTEIKERKKIDLGIQVQDSSQKMKLKAALDLIKEIQAQYHKLRQKYQRQQKKLRQI